MRPLKRLGMLPLLVALALLLVLPVRAETLTEEAGERFGTGALEEAVPEQAQALLDGLTPYDAGSWEGSLQSILQGAKDEAWTALRTGIGLCCRMLSVVLLSAVLRGFGPPCPAAELAAVLGVAAICTEPFSGLFTLGTQTMDSMMAFSDFLFPVLAASTAAGGAAGTSTALYSVTVLLSGLFITLTDKLFVPLITCYTACSIGGAAIGDESLSAIRDGIKALVGSGLKLLVVGFTAYLSLSSVISGSADTAAVKAAKLAISSAVPVVGSIIADASETLLVSTGLLRASVGIFGTLGILAICIVPFLRIGCQYLLLKLTAAVTAVLGERTLAGLTDALSGALGMLTALTGTCALVLIIACVCFMKVVAG